MLLDLKNWTIGNCIWRGKGFVATFHVLFHAAVRVLDFMCADVYPPCRAGLDLRGRAWRLAKDWGPRLARLWLQRMSSVYRELGGAETAAFTLYLKPHTYTHSHLHGRLELYWKPHKPSSVYVCLCYSWPLGLVAKTDRLTHIRSPECMVQAEWMQDLWMLTDQVS